MSGPRTPNAVWSSWLTALRPVSTISGNSASPPLISSKNRRGARGTWNGNPRTVNQTVGGLRATVMSGRSFADLQDGFALAANGSVGNGADEVGAFDRRL